MASVLNQKTVSATFTTSTPAYSIKDNIGGAAVEIAGVFDRPGQTATLVRARLFDGETQIGAKSIIGTLWSANPAASTLTDNAPFAFAAADFGKHQGSVRFASDAGAIHETFNATSLATQLRPQPVFSATTSLWLSLYTSDTPDWVVGTALTFVIDLVLDA